MPQLCSCSATARTRPYICFAVMGFHSLPSRYWATVSSPRAATRANTSFSVESSSIRAPHRFRYATTLCSRLDAIPMSANRPSELAEHGETAGWVGPRSPSTHRPWSALLLAGSIGRLGACGRSCAWEVTCPRADLQLAEAFSFGLHVNLPVSALRRRFRASVLNRVLLPDILGNFTRQPVYILQRVREVRLPTGLLRQLRQHLLGVSRFTSAGVLAEQQTDAINHRTVQLLHPP